tara:strand:+ start:991 stop:3249 length:2259 start_codon:yes stop_codon:yes gene_type:complete
MADEGKNKVAQSLVDMQPTAVLELFRIFPDKINHPTLFLGFHGGSLFNQSITWQGVQYLPVAIESEGFDILGDGKLARPKIRIANRNYLVTNFLQNYKDLINAKVIRKKVQVKFLDDVNFEGGNPFGVADPKAELADETWIMGRKTQESKVFVEFELNSPLDLENFSVNSRNVVAKFCGWQYRGEGCRYEGFPIEKDDGTPFVDADGNSVVPKYSGPPPVSFMESNFAEWNPTRSYDKGEVIWRASPSINIPPLPRNINDSLPRPLKTVYVAVKGLPDDINSGQMPYNNPSYWQKDGCTKKLSACQKRFNGVSDLTYVGGSVTNNTFPAINLSGKLMEGTTRIGDNTGFFHTHASGITGALTGDFTLMGWANVSRNSPRGAALWTSSLQDDRGIWPGARYLSLPLSFPAGDSRQERNDAMSSYVNAAWLGWRISPTNYASKYNVYLQTQLQTTQVPNNTDTDEWNCYIVTKGSGEAADPEVAALLNGEGQHNISNLDFFVNGNPIEDGGAWGAGSLAGNAGRRSERRFSMANQRLGNFGSLFERQAAAGTGTQGWPASQDPTQQGPMPVTFMIGAQQFFYSPNDSSAFEDEGKSSMNSINGSIGTWALWNRVLSENEIKYLVRVPEAPESSPNNVTHIARTYEQCTGIFGTITGSGTEIGGEVVIPEHSLIAWWDGTTGNVGNLSDPTWATGAMTDIHTGEFHLTGSGDFEQVDKSYYEGEVTVVKNPTPRNPRFGGFPGTDGFSYGRNTSL